MDNAQFEEVFFQAKLKVNRANRHIDEAQSWFEEYIDSDFYNIITDRDPETGQHEVRMSAQPVPEGLVMSIGDAFHCLSSALEYVMSGLMRAKTGNATRISFPTNESRAAFRRSFMVPGLDQSGRVKKAPQTRRIVEAFPLIVLHLLAVIKPYKGGNFSLWEVRKADNIDKHNLIIPAIVFAKINDVIIFDKVNKTTFRGKLGVSSGRIFIPIKTDGELEFQNKGHATVSITFPDTMEVFQGLPVFPTLLESSQLVSEAINSIERVARLYLP